MINLILAFFGALLLLALAGAVVIILWNLPSLLFYTLTDALKQPRAATKAARAAANDAKPPVESTKNRIAIALLLFAILVALPVIVVATAS